MKITSEQEMLAFGTRFAKQVYNYSTPKGEKKTQASPSNAAIVIELIGDVGAGKTTFVRGFAKGLGINSPVTSPSYTISKTYALPHDGELVHYDFYRLEDPGLMANNLDEAIKDNSIVVVEWGKSVQNILPKNRITISIKLQDDNSRKLIIRNNCNGTSRGLPEVTTDRCRRRSIKNKVFHTKSTPSGRPVRVEDEGLVPVTTGASDPSPESTLQLFLDTSTPETILKLNDHEYRHIFANDLAEKLLEFIKEKLTENGKTWQDVTKIIFMSGPGSFTGLRIGASVVNALAHELNIPLYDHHGERHPIILPDYGRPANIGKPKK
ncbi:tRNA (adenosine(37)-N6)-threonylcarbamoyltransferase complex ATPase subunit type 1 TsaE [Candidatus Saccharibacteria bacterium]|nr:tRNA (adenosine(37)-N6)-threonylcarbamoyltransferase complex ATPase subunit type 1 TsaE [Candidatus Saccharibacteria bacterium]